MADPVKGTDAILQIYKAGSYRDYLCATDVSVDFKSDLKSVKTIGDGVWKRSRPQSIGYTINLNGVVKIENGDDPAAFDVLEYQKQFVDIQYRITFTDSASSLRVIMGNAIVDNSQFSAGSEGFATAQFNMTGNGEPSISDSLIPCNITITDLTFNQEGPGAITTVNIFTSGTGSVLKYEYSIGGGSTLSTYNTYFQISLTPGTKSFTVTPVCTNGFSGTGRTETYNVI